MKKYFFFIAVLGVLTMVFCGAALGEVCTDSASAHRLCLEIQDEGGNVLDFPDPSTPLFHQVELDFGSFSYGKAVLKRVMVKNSSAGVNGSLSGNASNGFIWAWQNETPLSFIKFGRRTPTNIGGVRLDGSKTMPLDIVYAPLPDNPDTDGVKVNLEHNPFEYVDRVSMRINPKNLVNAGEGMGKRFDVAVENNGGETPVLTVTPGDLSGLGTDEYLLVYMEKEQLGDGDNPLVPLHFEESALNVRFPEGDQVEPEAGQSKWGFYRVPGSENIVVRFRGPDQKTIQYWFLFRDATPVRLKNHAYTRTISTSANLIFVYADGGGARNEFVQPVTVAAGTGNTAPDIPRIPSPFDGNSGDAPTLLSWRGGDPEGDSVTYTVEFGVNPSNLSTVAVLEDVTSWSLTGRNLQKDVTYYWRITASDGELSSVGATWRFTVGSTTDTTPPDGTIGFTPDTLFLKAGEKKTVELQISQSATEATMIILNSDSDKIRVMPAALFIEQGERVANFSVEALDDITEDIIVTASGVSGSPYYNDGEPFTMTVKPTAGGSIVLNPAELEINPGQTGEFTVSLSPVPADEGVRVSFASDSEHLSFDPVEALLTDGEQTILVTADNDMVGEFPVTITVTADHSDYSPATLEVTGVDNTPPYSPTNVAPLPGDDSVDIDTEVTLEWEGGDPDAGDTVSYDLYFGISETGLSIIATLSETRHTLAAHNLTHAAEYFWKVVARDQGGLTGTGGPWSFTTLAPRVRTPLFVPADQLFNDIENPLEAPVEPTPDEPIGQPLAAGNLDTGLMTIACKFPVYKDPVDIYLAFMKEGDHNLYLFTREQGQNRVSVEMKPWRSNVESEVNEVLFGAIPTVFLVKGEWTFFSVVTPAGEEGFGSADATRFKVTVP